MESDRILSSTVASKKHPFRILIFRHGIANTTLKGKERKGEGGKRKREQCEDEDADAIYIVTLTAARGLKTRKSGQKYGNGE